MKRQPSKVSSVALVVSWVKIKSILISLALTVAFCFTTITTTPVAFAQTEESGGASGASITSNPVTDFSIVLGAGLGGAILGLSTLSFVERPGQHLKNILIGTSIGIIVGVALVAWGQASKTQEQMSENLNGNPGGQGSWAEIINSTSPLFNTDERLQWHYSFADNGDIGNGKNNLEWRQQKYQKHQIPTFSIAKTFSF